MKIANAKLKALGEQIIPKWDEYKTNIKASMQLRYDLVKFKNVLESEYRVLMETFIETLKQHGVEPDSQGRFEFDMTKNEDLMNELNYFAIQENEVTFPELEVKETDDIPIELLDILFDFIKIV